MPKAKIGVIGGSGLYDIKGLADIEEVDKMKNGSFAAPVISPWSPDDGEAAHNNDISYIVYLSRCQ